MMPNPEQPEKGSRLPEGKPLEGRIALVTGIGPGMGKAVAEAFAAAGADVVLCARRRETVESVAATIEAMGRRSVAVCADIGDAEALDGVVDAALDAFGRVDIVYNNAHANPGVSHDGDGRDPLDCLKPSRGDWTLALAVNVLAPYRLAQRLLPTMKQRGYGSFITVLSNQAFAPSLPSAVTYGATKSALLALTRSLAVAGAPEVRVNALVPGAMTRDGSSLPVFGDIEEQIPLGRIGRADEIVGAALFLASDASSYMTGEVLRVDGGRFALGR